MMEKTGDLKSGFVLYFDNYPALAALSMEQRGVVLTALFAYGDRLRRGVEEPLEELLEQFPQLDQGARVVSDDRGHPGPGPRKMGQAGGGPPPVPGAAVRPPALRPVPSAPGPGPPARPQLPPRPRPGQPL